MHVHANLLGWVSMALMGLVYRGFPSAAASRLAAWHFVLYQAALPVMLGGLAALMFGLRGAEPVVGIASVVMLAGGVFRAGGVAGQTSLQSSTSVKRRRPRSTSRNCPRPVFSMRNVRPALGQPALQQQQARLQVVADSRAAAAPGPGAARGW